MTAAYIVFGVGMLVYLGFLLIPVDRDWFVPTRENGWPCCPVCGREDRNCQGKVTSRCGAIR